jgi:hypothetical protein
MRRGWQLGSNGAVIDVASADDIALVRGVGEGMTQRLDRLYGLLARGGVEDRWRGLAFTPDVVRWWAEDRHADLDKVRQSLAEIAVTMMEGWRAVWRAYTNLTHRAVADTEAGRRLWKRHRPLAKMPRPQLWSMAEREISCMNKAGLEPWEGEEALRVTSVARLRGWLGNKEVHTKRWTGGALPRMWGRLTGGMPVMHGPENTPKWRMGAAQQATRTDEPATTGRNGGAGTHVQRSVAEFFDRRSGVG